MRNSPDHVVVQARDILKLGDEQMARPGVEVGAVLVGDVIQAQGLTHFNVTRIMPLGAGARPDAGTFELDKSLAKRASAMVKPNETFLGIGHTHGPRVKNRGPSAPDREAAKNYPVSMLLKVDKNGGGRYEFFDAQRRKISATVIGLDGEAYGDRGLDMNANCWKEAA